MATSPHGCSGPSTPLTNVRATRARSARPASVTVSRTASPASAHPPSRPPSSRELKRVRTVTSGCTPDSLACVKLGCAAAAPRLWKTDGSADRSNSPDAVRYTSVDPATQRPTARRGDIRWYREETARQAAFTQLAGHFRWWWQVQDSNLGRRSRRFYSPSLLAEAGAAGLRLHGSRPFSWLPPSAMRPWAPGSGTQYPRTGTDGEGRSGCADRGVLKSRR
jgi:hypothetical protein